MLLAIDIGNSNIAIGLNDGSGWVKHWRMLTEAKRTADEYSSLLYTLFQQSQVSLELVDSAVLSSVVPELLSPFKVMIESLFSTEPVIVNSRASHGLNRESVPAEIGSDLLANAAAAHLLYPEECCMIIDFGTALTFTTVSEDGIILGVAIAPGVGSAVDALATKAAQLPHVDIKVPESVLGLDTVGAIQAGVIFGYTGLVSALIEQTEKEIGRTLKVIATGGFSKVIAPNIERIDLLKPWHTLDGLKYIYELTTAGEL